LVYSVEKTLKDLGDKAPADRLEKINQAKEELTSALAGDDFDLISEKKEQLQKELHELSAMIYQQTAEAGAQAQGEPGAEGPAGEEGPTVDAEYEVQED
jgi:molecular chaperone DnaK